MAEILDLTALQAHAAMCAGELSARECTAAWTAAAAGDELNAYLWRYEGEDGGAIGV